MVSVIIPVYNGEKYIADSINSVLKQTYSNIEIIVVDDGSEDRTGEIVKSFSKVKYFHKKNQGVSSSRNFGMSVAQGNYIAFLDADDMYTPDKIEKQVDLLKRNEDIEVVYNDGIIADENLIAINIMKSEYILENQADFAACLLFRQIVPVPASIMIRKKCISGGIVYDEGYTNAEDYGFIIRLAERYKFTYIPEPLYIYRRHENNLTNAHNLQKKMENDVIKQLGIEKIQSIVEKSSFPLHERKFLLAKIYIKIDEYLLAKNIMFELAKEGFECSCLWFYLGNCSFLLGESEEALKFYQNAVLADNKMAEAFNNIACIYANKDRRKATELLKQALKLRPDYMDAQRNLSMIEIGQTNYKITLRELRKVLISYSDISS